MLINNQTYSIVICPRSCLASVAPQARAIIESPIEYAKAKVVVVVCCHDESVLLEIECFFQLFTVSPKQSYLPNALRKANAESSCDRRECFPAASTLQQLACRSSDRRGKVGTWMRTGGWSSRSIWFVVPTPILFPAAMSMSAKEGIPASCWFHKW